MPGVALFGYGVAICAINLYYLVTTITRSVMNGSIHKGLYGCLTDVMARYKEGYQSE